MESIIEKKPKQNYHMPDDEDFEIRHLADQLGVSYDEILDAIQEVGTERALISDHIYSR